MAYSRGIEIVAPRGAVVKRQQEENNK